MEYLELLNKEQRAAVEATEGPTMVIAGAGSGKTRVLTYRAAHLVHKGVDPFSILALTFTNKAAREMKERIAGIVSSENSRNIWMGTFHSIFARILRVEADKIGFPANFTIYDTADSKNLLKDITKEMNLDEKLYKPAIVYGRISSAKNNLLSAKAYKENPEIQSDDAMSGRPQIGDIYQNYVMRCFKAGAMDFDDLLYKTNVLLRDHPDILHKYQHKFQYILVDEYQDTNYSQYLIVKKLAALNENICVVGDDAQSIYGFRGANIQNILNFKNDYPDYHMFKLEQNYRSTKNIVNAANSVIINNKEQIKKEVWTENEAGEKIKVLRALSDGEEGRQIASAIFDTKMHRQARNDEFAILYRTNAQSRAMEEALRKLDIPYRIYGGLSFYQRKEIKDLISYFRLCVNPADEEALKRVINYPARGIGKTTIEKIIVGAGENQLSLWAVLKDPTAVNLGINAGTRTKLGDFVTMIESFKVLMSSLDAYELSHHIAKSTGILSEHYADKTPEGISRYENIQELLNGIKEFTDRSAAAGDANTLPSFLQDVALLTDADAEKDDDVVSLMTIHAAKGLEFSYVFVSGMEENLFPSQLSLSSRTDLEEERRLFYVALTRAKDQIWLSYALSRYRWGNLIHCEPSRFLEEIDSEYLEEPVSKAAGISDFESDLPFDTPARRNPKSTSSKNVTLPRNPAKMVRAEVAQDKPVEQATLEDLASLESGARVAHQRFGKGQVVEISGDFPNQKAVVDFDGIGKKQLLLKFAKLEILK